MHNYYLIIFTVFVLATAKVDCGAFGRSGQLNNGNGNNGAAYGRGTYGNGNGYGYMNSPSRNMFMMDQGNQLNNKLTDDNGKISSRSGPGISAWGIITIILLVILLGMGGYYGIICYPLICKQERNYDIMDGASTTASTTTPTRNSDFEKLGNYSSRSTTPSVMLMK